MGLETHLLWTHSAGVQIKYLLSSLLLRASQTVWVGGKLSTKRCSFFTSTELRWLVGLKTHLLWTHLHWVQTNILARRLVAASLPLGVGGWEQKR